MPVIKPADLCGWKSASMRELKRARRSAQHTASANAAVQPNLGAADSDHRNRIIAGATPKAMTSDSESSSAPNLLCARKSRAMRPSMPSSTPATMTIVTAAAHSPPIAKRTPVRPEQSARIVIALCAKARRLTPAVRRPAASGATCPWSIPSSIGAPSVTLLTNAFDRFRDTDPRQDGFAGQRTLPQQDLRGRARGQIDVDTAAKPDEADALPDPELVTHGDKGHDAPRDKTRDLRKADAHAVGTFDDEMLALILLARLVEIGVQELAGNIDKLAQRPGNRGAVDMDVKDAHENRHAQHRCGAQPVWAGDFGGRRHFGDLRDQAVGWRDDHIAARRRDARRVAEKGADPDRHAQHQPAKDAPHRQQPQAKRYDTGDQQEFAAFGMDRRPIPFDTAAGAVR